MRFRKLHKAYARIAGYFWIPCPLCGQEFGGHEWRDIDRRSSEIAKGRKGICPDCTRAEKGSS